MTFLAATGVALAICLALEFAWGDSLTRASSAPRDLVLRLAGYLVTLLLWFAFSWRPWLAALTCVASVVALIYVSRAKRGVIGEPLLYSDFALLPQVPRHPQLYYLPPITDLRVAGPAGRGRPRHAEGLPTATRGEAGARACCRTPSARASP